MPSYTQQDLLRIARRVHNTKRTYLLVNPLQAKHIPVSPAASLEMMESLGTLLAERYPGTRLVIGFAETATAIGAAVAAKMGPDCVYLHTTREEVPEVRDWVLFSEEHSHAVEQKLCGDHLAERIGDTETVILADDEISTGKTLLNMVRQLRQRFPGLEDKRIVAASVLNRLTEEDGARLSREGISCAWLLKAPVEDAAARAAAFQVREALPPAPPAGTPVLSRESLAEVPPPLPDPRRGTEISAYLEGCRRWAEAFWDAEGSALRDLGSAVVLGTEECMYPALVLGRALESRGLQVRCHATTRSPIGLCGDPGYPIVTGNRLSSFYGGSRDTYLYNFAPCGALIAVTDARELRREALGDLAAAWAPYGFERLFCLQGGQYVWHLSRG